ncbi:MAG: N-formylglutamate amidohydrolase [Polyangiaceae bacterium]
MTPFEVTRPRARETPVVVEVPHASVFVPPEFLDPLVAPVRSLGRDADLHVDALYDDAPDEGATLLVAKVSRYVVDLNRAETDVDDGTVEGAPSDTHMAHGLVWRVSTEGDRTLARALMRKELELRLDAIHRPYHEALATLLAEKKARFGFAVLLAAHSMPSVARTQHGDAGKVRADVVPGTRGRTSAAAPFIDCVDAQASAAGYTVRHDDPYRGGHATRHYGRPSDSVHAVQVELARRLYMDESTLARSADRFARTRTFCRRLVRALGAVRPNS